MKILSLDVSGDYSSIALLNSEEINTFTQTHSRKDRPDWDCLFSRIGFDSKKDFDDLDALAYAQGPGSYTALRITASFLKAIAVIKNLPLIPISNLKSIAHEASNWIAETEATIFVAIEADKNESYFCAFKKKAREIAALDEESVKSLEELSASSNRSNIYFAGTGWPDPIKLHSHFLPHAMGSAEPIAALAKQELETGKVFDPETANPVYLKTPEYTKK